MRIGQGFDAHALVEGRPLALTSASPLVDDDGHFKFQAV